MLSNVRRGVTANSLIPFKEGKGCQGEGGDLAIFYWLR